MFDLMQNRKRPGRNLVGFKSEIDNLFNRFVDLDFPLSREILKEGHWSPRVDVSESERDITIQAEIPGCDAKDIAVSLEGRILTITGERKHEKEESKKNYIRVERAHGLFTRTLELPTEIDQDAIDAIYKKGVLTIVLKKTVPATVKTIEVKTT